MQTWLPWNWNPPNLSEHQLTVQKQPTLRDYTLKMARMGETKVGTGMAWQRLPDLEPSPHRVHSHRV